MLRASHHRGDGDGDGEHAIVMGASRAGGPPPAGPSPGPHDHGGCPGDAACRWRVLRVAAASAIGGFLFGFDTGIIAGALPLIEQEIDLGGPALLAAVVSATPAGAAVASLVGGALADAAGRRSALLAADALFVVGSLGLASARSALSLVAFRLVVGTGVGVASVAAPIYISECSGKHNRATLVSLNSWLITFGQFASLVLAYALAAALGGRGSWRWMFGLAAAPAAAQAAVLATLPESPLWLMMRGRAEDGERAARALGNLRKTLQLRGAARVAGLGARLRESPAARLALRIGVGLQVLQQLCGINTIMYYTVVIIKRGGVTDDTRALLLSILPAAVNCLGTGAGALLIDRLGRRKLALASLAGIACSLLLLGLALSARSSAWVMAGILTYLLCFAPGMGPVPWAVNAEIYEDSIRGRAMGVSTTSNWAVNMLVSEAFPILLAAVGGAWTFAAHAAVATVGFAVVFRHLPETKGLSLAEIQSLLAARAGGAGAPATDVCDDDAETTRLLPSR